MSLLTPSEIRQFAQNYQASSVSRASKPASVLLSEARVAQEHKSSFDVFLSHSFKDAQMILGVYARLVSEGLAVYVDWIVDPQLERGAVNSATAEQVRSRMRQSKALVYAHSLNSPDSKWMPWELGYFDGFRSTVAVLPISNTGNGSLSGVEYLSLYPYIDITGTSLWINRGQATDRLFGSPMSSVKSLRTWLSERS